MRSIARASVLQTVRNTLFSSRPTPFSREVRVNKELSSLENSSQLRIASYNILAACNTDSTCFPYTSPSFLNWDYRKHLIKNEVTLYDSDVICFQELEKEENLKFLSPALSAVGYDSYFYPKPTRPEGVGTYWKRNIFELVKAYEINFKDEANNFRNMTQAIEEKEQEFWSMFNRYPQVGLGVLLRSKLNKDFFVFIGNTHIHWDPKLPDLKAVQFGLFCQKIEQIVNQYPNSKSIPVFVCGDANSLPAKYASDEYDEVPENTVLVSGLYTLATTGRLPTDHPHHPQIRQKISSFSMDLKHSLQLESSMKMGTEQEPSFTCYTDEFKGTLDYIFYQPEKAQVASVLEIPPEDALCSEIALPNSQFPSDHLAIVANFVVSN